MAYVKGALGALLAAASFQAGLGQAAEKRFGLTYFDRVELHADAILEIMPGSPLSAVAEGDQQAIDRLQMQTRDGKLIISSRKFAGDERRKTSFEPLKIRLQAPDLREFMLIGGGDAKLFNMRARQVGIAVRGPGRVQIENVQADILAVQILGSGSLKLGGAAKQARFQLSGANEVDGSDLKVDDLALETEGVGDHRFHATKRAALHVRGAGRVSVAGQPACNVQNMGSDTVQCGAK